MALNACGLVLPVVGRCHHQAQGLFVEPFQPQNLAAQPVLDERYGRARLQVQQEQLAFEEVAAVIVAGAYRQQRTCGMEGHRVYPVAGADEGTAGQVTRVVDTYGCSTAELVRAGHGQQATSFVGDGQYGVADLCEGTVADDPVDGKREGHGADLRKFQDRGPHHKGPAHATLVPRALTLSRRRR